MSVESRYRERFEAVVDQLVREHQSGEHFRVALSGESSQFVRFNGGRVRQSGIVEDAELALSWLIEPGQGVEGLIEVRGSLTLGEIAQDREQVSQLVRRLRDQARGLPPNPFAEPPLVAGGRNGLGEGAVTVTRGSLLEREQAGERIASRVQGLDLVGIYAAGSLVRGAADSAGRAEAIRWFESESFCLDYSLVSSSGRALKSAWAGSHWDDEAWGRRIETERGKIEPLGKEPRELARGQYRVYLAPAAVEDLVRMMSWGCIGEAAIRQADSPLRLVRQGARSFSPKFSLYEDFSRKDSPRFNSDGELAPERLALVRDGQFVSALVNSKTAREYGLRSNGAEAGEMLRSPSVPPGEIPENEVLRLLGTGLYLSNLHYLNWSDQPGGRITGMTRHACFFVKEGKIEAPIVDMRFDDSLFSLFGDALEGFTRESEIIPNTLTYGSRQPGSARMPGAVLSRMSFKL